MTTSPINRFAALVTVLGALVTIMMILLTVAGELLLRLSGRLLLHGVCPVPARGRDPGAGPQAARDDAAARHDATRHDAACDAAARHDGSADADDDATLKSQTFVAATALIMSYRVNQYSYNNYVCIVVIIYFHPSFIMVLQ